MTHSVQRTVYSVQRTMYSVVTTYSVQRAYYVQRTAEDDLNIIAYPQRDCHRLEDGSVVWPCVMWPGRVIKYNSKHVGVA